MTPSKPQFERGRHLSKCLERSRTTRRSRAKPKAITRAWLELAKATFKLTNLDKALRALLASNMQHTAQATSNVSNRSFSLAPRCVGFVVCLSADLFVRSFARFQRRLCRAVSPGSLIRSSSQLGAARFLKRIPFVNTHESK